MAKKSEIKFGQPAPAKMIEAARIECDYKHALLRFQGAKAIMELATDDREAWDIWRMEAKAAAEQMEKLHSKIEW